MDTYDGGYKPSPGLLYDTVFKQVQYDLYRYVIDFIHRQLTLFYIARY